MDFQLNKLASLFHLPVKKIFLGFRLFSELR